MKLKRFLSAVMAAAVFAAAVPAGAFAEPETGADAAAYEAAANIENIDAEPGDMPEASEPETYETAAGEAEEAEAYESAAAEPIMTEPIMAEPEPIVQSADEVLHGETEQIFETNEENIPVAKTRVWNLGTYFVNGNEKAMEKYDAKYLVDKNRSATVTNNGQSYSGTQLSNCYDGDWKTHWETHRQNSDNFKNNIEFEFTEGAVEIGRIIFRARNNDGAPTKGYPYEFKIYYQGENDAEYKDWAVGSSASATTDIIEITVPTKTVKKLKFEYITAKENWAAAAEFRFYRTEHAQDDYMGLFLDSSCAALAHGVTAAKVIELEKNIDKYPAPLPKVLRAYVDAALSLLNVPGRGENVSAPITMSQRGNRGTEAGRVQTTFHIGGQYDITGLYAMPGEKIGIFVSYDPDGPAPRIVFATANQYRGGWFKSWDGVTLSNGYNEIDCTGMQCCQLIYLYNPALPQDQAFPPVARIVGGTEYPVYHYNADDPNLSDNPDEFKEELAEYVSQVADIDADSSSGKGKYNVCELVTKRIVLTTSARGALKGLESSAQWNKGYPKWQKGEAKRDPERVYKGAKDVMELWEQLMREDYAEYMGYNTTDPLGEDYEPRPAFLWRIHTDGVGWGWAQSVYASINAGNLDDSDPWDKGEFQSFTSPSSVLSAGWGTYHEIGHVYDNGAIGTSESTNNLYALNASLKYQGVSRMTNENRWFRHYVTAINTGVLPDGDLIFYPATVIFQLEMVDFKETALYPEIKSVYGKAARFSRLHSAELTGLPKDERLIVSLSMGNGVDLSDHFEVFGHKLSKEAKWLLKDLPKETRPLHYANERMLNGTAFTEEEKAIKPEFTAKYVLDNEKGKSDKKGSIVKIDIDQKNYTEADGKIKANLLCFEVWKTDVTNEGKGDRQFVGITGDDLRTSENELFSLEDNNVAPGHKYKYYVKPYDCSLHTPDGAQSESEAVDVPDSSYVAMTSLSINGKGTSGISVKPDEDVKVELGYYPLNTTYDFSCTNWELTTNNVRGVTLEEDPEYPGDPTHKILKTSANSRGTVSIKASAGGARGLQYMGYGRDEKGNYQTGMAVQADMRVTISGKEVEMTGIKIDQDKLDMSKGQTSQLTASILPEDATTEAAIRWSSSDDAVATVDQDTGLVTAVGNGTAEISAYVMESAEGGDDDQKIESTIKVTVSDSGAELTGIKIVSWADKEGETPVLYSGTKNFQNMKIRPVPENAEYDPSAVKWEVSQCKKVTGGIFGNDPDLIQQFEPLAKDDPTLYVASFGEFSNEKDKLEGRAALSAIIEIKATLEANGQTYTDTMDVQVDCNEDPELPIAIRSLTLNDTEQTMDVNETLDLSLTYAPQEAVGKNNVRWTTSDANVATVECDTEDITKAKVTAVAPGKAEIIGNWSGKRAVCEVTVTGEIELTDVKFKVKNNDQPGDIKQELVEGGSYQLMLYPVPVDATNTEATVWTTSDETVAKVNTKTGFVEAIAPGTAEITGTITQIKNDGTEVSYHKKCTFTVKKKEIALTGSAISENSKQLKPGETAELNISARPSNANMKTDQIEWKSSDDNVATVNMNGEDNRIATITAVAEGECQITGTMGGFPVTCEVAVENEKQPTTLTLIKDGENVTGSKINLSGTNDSIWLACYVDGGVELSKDEMYWNSSNSSVVEIDENGKITAVGAGTATISATATAHIGSAECTIIVPDKVVERADPTAPPTQSPAPPTATPEPGSETPAPATASPSATPTATPTTAPTASPSATPTTVPATAVPATAVPTANPSATPTTAPTASPSATPTTAPATAAPTATPSATPTTAPATAAPVTASPSATSTTAPATAAPATEAPATSVPTASPSATPTMAPATASPSAVPTIGPATMTPTAVPEYEYTIDEINIIGDMVEVSVTENFGTGGTLIICSYNADGALTDIKTKPVRFNTVVSEIMNIADAKTITAFVWDDLGGLKPLALPKTTEIK